MLQIGPLILDFTPLLEAAARSPWSAAWYLFSRGGWIPLVVALLLGLKWMWLLHITRKVQSKWKWVLLAVDVPAENIQSPKAVENIMAHLAGAHKSANLLEKYITGFAQPYFSLEVVSVNGFIRFFIYTTVDNRDLVESAIYAQYPTAEISEADDYTAGTPVHFPDPEYDLWGTEFVLTAHQAYPIRTWEEFHDPTSEERMYKDPMAALLETMSSLREGEQLWLQIIITPIKSKSWQDKSYKVVADLAGQKAESKKTWLDKILSVPSTLAVMIIDAIMPGTPAADKRVKEEAPSQMLYLTPGEREVVEAIENKAAKIGFHTKIRAVYLAKHEVFHKARAVYGLIGAVKQLNTEDMNSLKPELRKVGTHTKYFWKETRKNWRKVKVMRAYKFRSNWRGMLGYVMNVEELATVWHFPLSESVKAPLIKKAESKRAEPPHELPVEFPPAFRPKRKMTAAAAAPSELPQEESEAPRNLPVG